jgi:hypothetical protein
MKWWESSTSEVSARTFSTSIIITGALIQLGDGGDQTGHAVGDHVGRHAHGRPVQAQDGINRLDQEALGVAVVLGDDHDFGLVAGDDAGVLGQIDHRNQGATQADHAFNGGGHFGSGSDFGVRMTSRTLKTLMPKTSFLPVRWS